MEEIHSSLNLIHLKRDILIKLKQKDQVFDYNRQLMFFFFFFFLDLGIVGLKRNHKIK